MTGRMPQKLEILDGQVWFPQSSSRWRAAGRWLFLLLVCAYFGYCYASHPSFLNLSRYTRGEEELPFQYRVLPVLIFRLLLRSSLFLKIASHLPPLDNDPYRLVMAAIGFAGLLGAVVATAATLRRLTGDAVFAFWGAMLVAFMADIDLASSWSNWMILPYDVPSLMFFAIAMYLVLCGRWSVFYPVWLLAVLNRETACFITVFFFVWEWFRLKEAGETPRARLRWIVPNALAQVILWIIVKKWLALHFANNPFAKTGYGDGLFTTHFSYNLKELMKPFQWPLLLSVCGFSLPFLWLQRRWIGCAGLAWSIAIILPLSFAGFLIVGIVVEIRIFSDWIALVAPAIALIVWHRFRPVDAGFAPQPTSSTVSGSSSARSQTR